MKKSTQTVEASLWKLMNFRLTAVEPPMKPNKALFMWERVLKSITICGLPDRRNETQLGPPYVGENGEACTICGIFGSRNGIYPWCMSQLVAVHSLWWEAMFSLNSGGRSLVVPQLNVPELVDIGMSGWQLIQCQGWEGEL